MKFASVSTEKSMTQVNILEALKDLTNAQCRTIIETDLKENTNDYDNDTEH